MAISLQFLGAAQNITGSSYLLQANGRKILIDCGLYQEREFRYRNFNPFPVDPESIDAVLLTHAHLDHCGLLPKLVKEGFTGKIICTPATEQITKIILQDAGRIQEEDAIFKKKRHERERRKGAYPEIPLYTEQDAKAVFPLFKSIDYQTPIKINESMNAIFYDAGHILGSAMIKVTALSAGIKRTIVFSGDLGRWDKPIIRDPSIIEEADYILVESTYGDRLHEDSIEIKNKLSNAINSTEQKGGNIVIPSFTVGRTQELLYYLNELLKEDRIPHLITFVDSPMAINVIDVFKQHPECFDKKMRSLTKKGSSPFYFTTLKLTRRVAESKAINRIRGSSIIIASSGMCTGGRIKHHLKNNISRPQSSILFVGYQAKGTLGRQIINGIKKVRIYGTVHPVKAQIIQINGFSAHADKNELLRWLSGFKSAPKKLFVVHGEEDASLKFARTITAKHHWEVAVPRYKDKATLS